MADTVRIVSVVFLSILNTIFCDLSSVDLNTCKLTHSGTEYTGKVSRTETNVTCQYWSSATQKGSEQLIDEAFPDGSKILAKNYCRNPDKNPKGPWCYTTQEKLINATCEVPLCKTDDCRVSGTGMEYTGPIKKSSSGKRCTKWSSKHKLADKQKVPSFKDRYFGDGSIGSAENMCRNPDGNIYGPWCYVERDDSDLHAKELCDIPFCDDLGLVMYSEGSPSDRYFFFSSVNESRSFNISFRLWNPADWLRGQVYLYFSAYDIAADRNDIERWASGVEIMLSHAGSGILAGEEDTLTKTPLILSGAKWTDLEITWVTADSSVLIQVFQKPKTKPIAMSEILIKNTIFEVESFRFFSLTGSPTLWNVMPDDDDCFIHTVSQMNFTRFWLIKKTTLSKDIEIFVRAIREAVVTLRSAPMVAANQVQITIGIKDKINIVAYDSQNSSRVLRERSWPNLLDFWKWEYFKITLLNDKIQVYWVRQTSTEVVVEANHPNIESVMWVTFGSPVTSYWTIYCDPRGIADPPPPAPPECVSEESEVFNGTLSVTKKGRQCIPWTDITSIPQKYHNVQLFEPYGGKATCENFCRNLDNDPKGPYCIVRDDNSDLGFGLEHCHPRSCSLGDCKIAGTGNDYIGQLNTTRSKRTCKIWLEVHDNIIDVRNFPDPTLKDAGNFCRNPSKSMSGSWCFTSDPKVPRDFCYIKDCDRSLECTVLTSGYIKGTLMYILPHWREHGLKIWLKSWNPDTYEGLMITMSSMDLSQEYELLIGDENNERLRLIYKGRLLVQKTLPHLIPTGKWGGYWLRPGPGKIELGYHGVPNSFFEWSSTEKEFSFEPVFLNFGTIQNRWIGVNFDCTECLVEKISSGHSNKMYPINLWTSDLRPSSLRVNLRGTGSALITLMWNEDFSKYFAIQILSEAASILLLQYINGMPQIVANLPVNSPLLDSVWSEYVISFTEDTLTVHKDGVHQLDWSSNFPLLFYWFSVSAERGSVTWSANCPAADIDGEPRNGNWGYWGPWSCSVSCGRGEGRTQRECNNPPPNVLGRDCKGSSVYEGPCNDFPCGEISPGTNNMIRQYLSSHFKALEVEGSERVVLTCNAQAISLITAEVHEVNITWSHNGFPYSRTKFHMNENYSLVIPQAQEKHNGVYLCMALQDPDSAVPKVVLDVVSLVVIRSKSTKKIRKGRSLTLKCNGLALSYVYADISQRWELNGSVWKDYGLGTFETFSIDKLENISDSHAGVWACVIIQEDLRFRWTTNWFNLKVKSAPSFWSHLMEDVATAPLFGKLGNERNAMILFFSLVGILTAVIVVVTIFLVKWLRK